MRYNHSYTFGVFCKTKTEAQEQHTKGDKYMNNRQGMMTSILAIGAAGAAIYGITRGVQNGTFKNLPQTISNALNNSGAQQLTQPLQNMTTNQNVQQLSSAIQGETDNSQQQTANNIQ